MKKSFRVATMLFVSLFAIAANGAPMAYSVNSDSGNESTMDGLFLIDLATGIGQRKGTLFTGVIIPTDTEGLAMAPGGTLWGIDDDTVTLFPINKENGSIDFSSLLFPDFPSGGKNDFGMTFSCDGILYVTSVVTGNLYQLDTLGNAELIGPLGVNISAIAAYGNPVKLYGLGNGQFLNGETDSPNLYSIDINTGAATLIGPLGPAAGAYNQGGLAFDSDGTLWAITDRRIINNTLAELPSQILRFDELNDGKGTATLVSETSDVGFESLAISEPTACKAPPVLNRDDIFPPIPTLSFVGRLLTVFFLMLVGMFILRRRVT